MNTELFYKLESKELFSPIIEPLEWENVDCDYYCPIYVNLKERSFEHYLFKITPLYQIGNKYWKHFASIVALLPGHASFRGCYMKSSNVIYLMPSFSCSQTINWISELCTSILPCPKIEVSRFDKHMLESKMETLERYNIKLKPLE